MRIKCPSCFAEFDLASALDSEAGRELMVVLAKLEPATSRPLVSYLGLFRSASRALSFDRALRLAQEVLALDSDKARLSTGLAKAVEILREKQASGNWKPMNNHNYLKRVLEGLPSDSAQAVITPTPMPARPTYQSKTAAALFALEDIKNG